MRSVVKANGDVIKQWELQAVLGADRALNALVFNIGRRIALGASVQRGPYDVGVEDFQFGRPLDLAQVESSNSGPTGDYNGGIQIETAAKVASDERIAAGGRAARARKAVPRAKPARESAPVDDPEWDRIFRRKGPQKGAKRGARK